MILVLVLNGCILQQAITNLHVMALVEQLKQHVGKRSFQWFLNNQILDYKAILDLCENEMMSINLFGICKRAWSVLKSLKLGNDMKVGRLSLSHGVVTI